MNLYHISCYLCCSVVICVVLCIVYVCVCVCVCVNVYCHRVTTQLQLIYHIICIPVHAYQIKRSFVVFVHSLKVLSTEQSFEF
jgi:cytochrome c oxidase subunit IV